MAVDWLAMGRAEGARLTPNLLAALCVSIRLRLRHLEDEAIVLIQGRLMVMGSEAAGLAVVVPVEEEVLACPACFLPFANLFCSSHSLMAVSCFL